MAKRKQKSRVPKLTKRELKLCQYPPNEDSWECTRRHLKKDDSEEIWICGMVNRGSQTECNLCRQPKDKNSARLLHPIYNEAMMKLGLSSGTLFMVNEFGTWKIKPDPEKGWVEWTEEILDGK